MLHIAQMLGGHVSALISYFSLEFLVIFLPIFLIGYGILPQKVRKYFTLLSSWVFFWLISGKLIGYMLCSTVSIYCIGLWMESVQKKRDETLKGLPREEKKTVKQKYMMIQRRGVLIGILINLGLLIVLKYSGFFATNINTLFRAMHLSVQVAVPKFLMPIGISFYSMQAVSYVVDVYRGVVKADHNFGRLALYMGFFPQIVEGPICRYGQTANQLWEAKPITYANLTMGLQRIMYGMMKKVIIADRLNPLVKEAFLHYKQYDGGILALAMVCYTIQLYCDFSGSMDAVCGISQILGVTMPENFQRPFFSKSISEFWQRWHISLGLWFKDYIFYPVSMSKPMKNLTSNARKKLGNHFGPLVAGSIALFCVWLANGLWHGSAWNYIFFGMYHFALILLSNLTSQWTSKCLHKWHVPYESKGYHVFRMIRTTILVCFGELFFRAHGLVAGLKMFKRIFTKFTLKHILNGDVFDLQVGPKDFTVVGVALIVIFTISMLNERGISVREWLARQKIAVRWALLLAMVFFILIFGAYGMNYVPVDPMYAEF